MTEEEFIAHSKELNSTKLAETAFKPKKPLQRKGKDSNDDEKGGNMPMAQSNIPAGEETEIVINEKGDIVDERVRNDLPR